MAVSPSAIESSFAAGGLSAKQTPRERRAIFALVGFGFLIALILGATQNPVMAAIPVAAVLAGWVVAKTRRWYLIVALFGLYQAIGIIPLAIDGAPGYWLPPLLPVYLFLTRQLPIKLSGLELCYVAIFAVAGLRWLLGIRTDTAQRQSGSRMLYMSMLMILVGVFFIEFRGILRGYADIRQSLWQFHGLLWLPVLTLFLASCVRSAREASLLLWVFTFAAMFKIAWGVYLFATLAWPYGVAPESMTGHEDSVLYTACVFAWISVCVHRPTRGNILRALFFGGWILYGIGLNNRRIAYVCLLVALFMFYLMLQGPIKRAVTRFILKALPFVLIYLAVGAKRPHGIFKPAAMIMSVGEQKDASSLTRDIENYNLIQTLKPNMVFGTGWGYEYQELVKAYDISKFFPQYRYIAHNSILWLFSIGGFVGFTLLWIPFAVATFLGVRSYRAADHWMDKTAASVAVGVLGMYQVMAWGDMGTQGMMSGQVVATALMIIAKLSYSTGAWPAGVRLFGRHEPARRPRTVPVRPPVTA